MSEVSLRKIEANRRNAQKSTGPRTREGKARSRFNALQDGLRAKTVVLPGEDASAFEARLVKWNEEIGPRDDVERFLVRRAVQISWQLDRIERLQMRRPEPGDPVARLAEDVLELGARLFHDRRGPNSLYPHWIGEFGELESISWNAKTPIDHDDPARLLLHLESSAMGCAWLLDQWDGLRRTLESGDWQPPDRFRAIRLLGRQPIEVLEDDRVRMIYLACSAMKPGDNDPLADLSTELKPRALKRISARLHDRMLDSETPNSPDSGRSALIALIEEECDRLEDMLSMYLDIRQTDQLTDELEEDARADRLRRHQAACDRTLLRVLDTIRRRQRESGSGSGSDSPSPRASRRTTRTPDPTPLPTDPIPAPIEPEPAPQTIPPQSVPAPMEPEPAHRHHLNVTNEPNLPDPDRPYRLAPILALLIAFLLPGRSESLRDPTAFRANEPTLPQTAPRRPFSIENAPDRARRAGPSPHGPDARRILANRGFPCTPPVL